MLLMKQVTFLFLIKLVGFLTNGFKRVQDTRLSRVGVSLLSGIDGINNGWLATVNARFEALNRMDADGVLDKIMEVSDNPKLAKELEQSLFRDYKNGLFNSYLDEDGLLTDQFTKLSGQEINLNGPNDFASYINKGLNYSPMAKAAVKFLPTMGNAFTYNMTFIPGASLVLKRHRKLFFAKTSAEKTEAMKLFGIPEEKFSEQRFVQLQNEHLGRWGVFSSFAITAGFMAEAGQLNGYGPRNPEERKDWLRFNKPYHIKMGGKWVSYENLGPITTAIGFATDLSYELKQGNLSTENYMAAAHSLYSIASNNFLNTSTFFDAFEPLNAVLTEQDPTKFAKFAATYSDQYIPFAGMRSWVNSIASPEFKELDRTFSDYAKNRNKAFTKLPDQVDIYDGSVIGKTDGFGTWYNSLMPYLRYGGEPSKIKTFLSNTPWNGGFKPYSIDGVKLNNFERNRLNTLIASVGKKTPDGKNYLTKEVERIMNPKNTRYQKEIKEAKEIMRGVRQGRLTLEQATATIGNFGYAKDLLKVHNEAFNQAKGLFKKENTELSQGLMQRIKSQKLSELNARRGNTGQVKQNMDALIEYNSSK